MHTGALDELCAQMQREIPGFSVGFKDQSWHQRALGTLLWPCLLYTSDAADE